MDFTNHPINRLSIIDHREVNKVNPSIIDSYTFEIRNRLHDQTIDERFIKIVVQKLSEKDIEDLLDYVERKATTHKGKAFVKLCSNIMKYPTI